MNISGPAAVAKPEMLFYAPGDLTVTGCTLLVTNNEIVAKHRGREVKLVVYPAMWKEPREDGTIYVSDAYIKYAKPYAVQKILNV